MEPWHLWTLVALAAWAGLIALAGRVMRHRIRDDDFDAELLVLAMHVYARLVHRLRIEGAEHIPVPDATGRLPHPLIVAANHTAGVDPVLIQAAIRFEPRWMMAEDMRAPALDWVWTKARIIFVDRASRESRSAREALRHLKSGGVLGVFPEGHIERPPEHLLPFRGGVGFLIAKSGAPVLPVVLSGTPQVDPAWAALARTSRSVVRFLPMVRYPKDATPDAVSDDLFRRFAEATGWPTAPRVPILENGRRILVDVQGRYIDERGDPMSDEEAAAAAAAPNAATTKESP